MKKLTLLFLVIALLALSISCSAENLSIGSGLATSENETNDPSSDTIGSGLSLSPPISSDRSRSANDHSGMRPSPEWLSKVDAEHISDLCASFDDTMLVDLLELSDAYLDRWAIADKYNTEPSYIIYAPKRLPALYRLALAEYDAVAYEDPDKVCNTLTSTIFTSMDYEDDIRTTHLIFDSSYPVDTPFVPTIAVYTAADGSESDAILITHVYDDGIMHINSRFISYDGLKCITDKDSSLYTFCRKMNADIFTSKDEFPDFDAALVMADDIIIPETDSEWLTKTSIELVTKMLRTRCSAKYAEMHTINQDIIDTCTEIGSFDIQNATVLSIEPVEIDQIVYDTYNAEPSDLIKKYIAPSYASAVSNLELSNYGTVHLSAAVICAVSDSYFASADFAGCNVTIGCGGEYNIIVSFANMGNDIVTAITRPVPAK